MKDFQTIDISVVLPVFNGIKYLKKSVDSVLEQKTENINYEFLICDDCSTDSSFEFLNTIDDERVKIFQNKENKGLFPTLNFLIKNAKGRLVHLWAQDDVMLDNCLREMVKFHREFPEVNFSFSRLQGIDSSGKLYPPPSTFENKILSPEGHAISSILYGSISGNIANVCLVKEACKKVGYFDENMIYVGDFKMWCLLSKDKPVGMCGQILVHVRQHKDQLSKNLEASYYKLIENLEVYECFSQTVVNRKLRNQLQKALKWKIYPYYMNQLLYIIWNGNFKLSRKYLKGLIKYDYFLLMSIRFIIVKTLRVIKLDHQFFSFFFYRKIDSLKNTNEKENHY